jgi:hypothetical protein
MNILSWSAPNAPCNSPAGVCTDKNAALVLLQNILEQTPGHLYKIGITGNPQSRLYHHEGVEVDRRDEEDMIYVTIQKGLWSQMHLIYRTPNEASICQAEREFIQFALRKYGGALRNDQKLGQQVFPFNVRAGGGGKVTGSGPYYLYVLRSQG